MSAINVPITIGLLIAISISILWGIADFCIAEISKKSSTFVISSCLYLIETPIILIAVFMSGKYGVLSTNFVLFLFGVCSLVGFLVFVQALRQGHISIVASITGLLSVIVPAVFSIAVGEPSTLLVWIGLVLVCVAIFSISQVQEPDNHEDKVTHRKKVRLSIFLGVISGVLFGLFLIGLGHVESPLPMKVFMIQLPGFIFATIFFMIKREKFTFFRENFIKIMPIALLYQLPQALFPVAVGMTSLIVANIITNLYPGVTIFLAWVLLKQKTSRVQNIGFILAVLGTIAVSIGMQP